MLFTLLKITTIANIGQYLEPILIFHYILYLYPIQLNVYDLLAVMTSPFESLHIIFY